jgi:hypothetical protein
MTMYRQMEGMEGGRSVFVDERGVRARRVAWAGRVCAAGFALYLVAVVASLVGAPWVPKAGLPGVNSALPVHTSPRVTLPESALRLPSPIPAATPAAPTKSATTTVRTNTTRPPAGVTTTSAPTTTTTTRPGNRPTTSTTVAPGNSGTAPGHSRKP